MVITASKKAETDFAGEFLRITSFCKTAKLSSETKMLRRHQSGQPTALEITTICAATEIIDCEISASFAYHVFGTNVQYDAARHCFSMICAKSFRLEDDAEIAPLLSMMEKSMEATPEVLPITLALSSPGGLIPALETHLRTKCDPWS